MRIDMGGSRGLDGDAERLPAFEPAGTHPFAAQDSARAGRRRRGLDALAGSLLAACAVAVLVNVFIFQNGNRPNLMFGFKLPEGVAGRISMAPPDPPPPAPAAPPVVAARPAPVAPPVAAAAPAPTAPAAGAPTSITALLNGTAGAPAAARPPQPLVADVQRELAKRGLYDGPADGRTGPKTEAAIRAYEQSARLKVSGEASDALLAQMRRSTSGLTPPANVGGGDITGAVRPPGEVPVSPRVLAVQKTLSKLGYGPLKITGRPSAETRQAVQRFERDRNLTPDGEISDRVVRELAAVSGTALE